MWPWSSLMASSLLSRMRFSTLILYIFCTRPGISRLFQETLVFFFFLNDKLHFKSIVCILGIFTDTRLLFLGLFSGQSQGCMCVCIYVQIYASIYLYIYSLIWICRLYMSRLWYIYTLYVFHKIKDFVNPCWYIQFKQKIIEFFYITCISFHLHWEC